MTFQDHIEQLVVGDWESGEPARVARAARVTAMQFRSRPETAAQDFALMFQACADALDVALSIHMRTPEEGQ